MVVAGATLVEAYSVLTRLPTPYRLTASDTLQLIDKNFSRGFTCVTLNADDYMRLLRAAPAGDVAGGRIYDAAIAQCARKAGARTLLTFNASHFAPFAGPDLAIVVPA